MEHASAQGDDVHVRVHWQSGAGPGNYVHAWSKPRLTLSHKKHGCRLSLEHPLAAPIKLDLCIRRPDDDAPAGEAKVVVEDVLVGVVPSPITVVGSAL